MQWVSSDSNEETAVEVGLKEWEKCDYTRPKIIYWNLGDSDTSPSTSFQKDVCLVSGFSPSILTAILGGEDFSPIAIMDRAISKYEVVDPKK